ncbi:MAG: cation:proton antiporter [Armatimonadota bacterium]
MRLDPALLWDITFVIAAGWLGGALVSRLRLPFVVGYVLAGALIGPFAFRLVGDSDHVRLLANLGVVFLLFALGVQFQPRELLRLRRVGIGGGLLQVAATVALGFALGMLIGWSPTASLILGFVLAVSSTTVLVKMLQERGEARTQYARVATAISITQDLSTVAMVSVLPALGSLSVAVLPEMGLLLFRALLFIAVILFLARDVIPPLLRRVSRNGSRELFLITVLVISLLGAGAAQWFGLSLALGAFLAGIMISESEFHHETAAIVTPLRDAFALVFFVSLGMFFDLAVFLQQWVVILVIVLVLALTKFALVAALVLWAGYHLRTAIMAGIALIPISEYSFIVAILAVSPTLGYVSTRQYEVMIAASIISILITPVLLHFGDPLYRQALRLRPFRRFAGQPVEEPPATSPPDRVVVCGHGRVGRIVSEALRNFLVPLVVIDYDQREVKALHGEGIEALYGDATNPVLLREVGADRAAMVIVCLSDSRSMRLALRQLKRLSVEVPVVARALSPEDIEAGYAGGSQEMVEAEFECGLELARHTLRHLGKNEDLVQRYVDQVRLYRYQSPTWRAEEGDEAA